MSILQFLPRGEIRETSSLAPIIETLRSRSATISEIPTEKLLDLLDDFSRRLLADMRTKQIDGLVYLASWLRRTNIEKLLRINFGGSFKCLDHFETREGVRLAAKPRGLVAMWMAGNVSTLPMFSIIHSMLAKNVSIVKLAQSDPSVMDPLLSVFEESEGGGLRGSDLLSSIAVVWFDYKDNALNNEMSLAADTKVVWGRQASIEAISALPRHEHCTEIIFGPKYSIGVIDHSIPMDKRRYRNAISGFVRDIAAFDQRACSAPQTIFIEHNSKYSLTDVGAHFAEQMHRLPPKPSLDAYSTLRILNARAKWGLHAERSVIASGIEAEWTVCMDHEVSLKEAVQSRTIFLSEIDHWKQILPLLSLKIQTVGIAFGDELEAEAFSEAATLRGVARCVRPGLMNGFESPWDGKLFVSELTRWVTLKP